VQSIGDAAIFDDGRARRIPNCASSAPGWRRSLGPILAIYGVLIGALFSESSPSV
jgi:hypothetical protein